MNHKRWLEIGSGLLLLLAILGAAASYCAWQAQRLQAMHAFVDAMDDSDTQAMRLAILRGAEVHVKSGISGSNPLTVAVLSGDGELVRLLLERGADPNSRGSRNMTPLMYQPSLHNAEALITYGANVNATDQDGRSALTSIVRSDDEESLQVAQLLLRNGARPRPEDLRAARGKTRMTLLLKSAAAKQWRQVP